MKNKILPILFVYLNLGLFAQDSTKITNLSRLKPIPTKIQEVTNYNPEDGTYLSFLSKDETTKIFLRTWLDTIYLNKKGLEIHCTYLGESRNTPNSQIIEIIIFGKDKNGTPKKCYWKQIVGTAFFPCFYKKWLSRRLSLKKLNKLLKRSLKK